LDRFTIDEIRRMRPVLAAKLFAVAVEHEHDDNPNEECCADDDHSLSVLGSCALSMALRSRIVATGLTGRLDGVEASSIPDVGGPVFSP
jgi:hypothetical protein